MTDDLVICPTPLDGGLEFSPQYHTLNERLTSHQPRCTSVFRQRLPLRRRWQGTASATTTTTFPVDSLVHFEEPALSVRFPVTGTLAWTTADREYQARSAMRPSDTEGGGDRTRPASSSLFVSSHLQLSGRCDVMPCHATTTAAAPLPSLPAPRRAY